MLRSSNRVIDWLDQRLPAEDRRGVGWATAWFFCLLFGYYQLRPLREAKGFANGADDLPWLFLGSFVVMLLAVPVYGAVVNRGRGIGLVRRIYGFFAVNLLAFFFAMLVDEPTVAIWVGRVYFVWLSVFNLFVISLMWSVLADIFRTGQAKRYFGWVSAGGTLGGIAGSEVANWLSEHLDLAFVPLVSAGLLLVCQFCAGRLIAAMNQESLTPVGKAQADRLVASEPASPKASIWAGVIAVFTSPYLAGIFAFLLAIQACGTMVYCQQGDFIREAGLGETARFELLARINSWVLVCTLLVQLLGTAAIVRRLGLALVLGIFPALYLVGFALLWWTPQLSVVVGIVIVHRAAAYAVVSPAVQVLYTVIDKSVLYKVKSFLDTAVVRGGDLMSAQLFGLLRTGGTPLSTIALGFLPVAAFTCMIGFWVGRRQKNI